MASRKTFHDGRAQDIVSFIASVIDRTRGDAYLKLANPEYLRAVVEQRFPELRDKEHCANCGASMQEYIFTFDAFKAILLLTMARKVNERLAAGLPFPEANRIRIPELPVSLAVKCQTTQASKLGLVAQALNEDGRRVAGTWLITRRGWGALAGQPVPKSVLVWRGEIEDRYEGTTTIHAALRQYGTNSKVSKEKREEMKEVEHAYDPREWIEFAGTHAGAVL